MKNLFYTLLIIVPALLSSQKLEFTTLLEDQISIRAIEIWNQKVYYAGTDSKFGYAGLTNISDQKQIKLSNQKLQFRTLAQDSDAFYTINIESPAQFFRIDKKSLNVEVIHEDSAKNAFYDALLFHKNHFYTFSDTEENLDLKFAKFKAKQGKITPRYYSEYKMNKGEAAFAASNTNISAVDNFVWLATGGVSSRIFRLNLNSDQIDIFPTPFIQGESSQGIYSIDFYDKNFGIAVGGDYTKQQANINNIATTKDSGKTWTVQASGKNAGYKTCVKFRPNSGGKEIITVGDQNIEYSADYGKTWETISTEKGLFVCEWIDKNTIVFAGKNRIIKATFTD